MTFLNFRTLAAIFEFYMASQSPQNPLKTFLKPMASFSQSLGPFRAMAIPFMPKTTTIPHLLYVLHTKIYSPKSS